MLIDNIKSDHATKLGAIKKRRALEDSGILDKETLDRMRDIGDRLRRIDHMMNSGYFGLMLQEIADGNVVRIRDRLDRLEEFIQRKR